MGPNGVRYKEPEMAITNLQQALDNIPGADSLPTYDSQLQAALAYWQSVQSSPATADQGANFDTAADDGSGATSDAVAAIAFIQAEIARIGG